ncbi:MAG: sulfatase-like hydrolase/transferase [Deltaproteobacteria bacterium]|nr:sulfatase-like hydrolase/transferase [Deltaproteobacteria bacterium]
MKFENYIKTTAILLSLFLTSCLNNSTPPEPRDVSDTSHNNKKVSSEKKAGEASEQINTSDIQPSGIQPTNVKLDKIYDFVEHIDDAHIRSGGLLIDFGTDSRNKYTLGDWKSGWKGNYTSDGVTYSYISGRGARIYFYLNEAEKGEGQIVIKIKGLSGKTDNGSIYVNDKKCDDFKFASKTFEHVIINTDNLKQGNNEIILTLRDSYKIKEGGTAKAAVDYVKIIPADSPNSSGASSVNTLTGNDADGVKNSLILNSEDSASWYFSNNENYSDAYLTGTALNLLKSTKTSCKITITTDNPKLNISKSVNLNMQTNSFHIPLKDFINSAIKVTFTADNGDIKIISPAIEVMNKSKVKASGTTTATNVVLVLIDTLRADHLSIFNKNTRVQTPFIKKIAEESMIFSQAMAEENWTKPSIASLLTGLYPSSHQTKSDTNKLPSSAKMISEYLKAMGFQTAGFVANGYISNKFGFERGWDFWTNYVREGKKNRAQFVADDSVEWLKKRYEKKPFFMYIHTIDPHVPYIPPAKYRALYDDEPYNGPIESTKTADLVERVKTGALKLNERDKFRLEALYDGEISYHDDHLARVYKELANQDLLKNTIIVITADHGEEFFDHGLVGHGHSLYEELIHVPLIIRLPGANAEKSPKEYNEVVELVDILPTLFDSLGLQKPEQLQGESLIPVLKGEKRYWSKAVYSEFMDGQRTVKSGIYKLILRGLKTTLFNLLDDPKETADLSDVNPLALRAMLDSLGSHLGIFVSANDIDDKNRAPKKRAQTHKSDDANIDNETKKQLQELGYMID